MVFQCGCGKWYDVKEETWVDRRPSAARTLVLYQGICGSLESQTSSCTGFPRVSIEEQMRAMAAATQRGIERFIARTGGRGHVGEATGKVIRMKRAG